MAADRYNFNPLDYERSDPVARVESRVERSWTIVFYTALAVMLLVLVGAIVAMLIAMAQGMSVGR